MSIPKTIDPDARYSVVLSGVAEHGGKVFLPSRRHVIRGTVLKEIKNQVESAKKVD